MLEMQVCRALEVAWSNENDVTKKWVMGGRMEKNADVIQETHVFDFF
jgi:hypothetical protein